MQNPSDKIAQQKMESVDVYINAELEKIRQYAANRYNELMNYRENERKRLEDYINSDY